MGRKPKYQICRDLIVELIAETGLRPGDAIPSINQLIERFGMVRTNVQNALNLLCREGVLDKRPGSGCYLKEMLEDEGAEHLSQDVGPMIDYMHGLVCLCPRGTLRVGILQEMRVYPEMWRGLFAAFQKDSGITVEVVSLDNMAEVAEARVDIFQVPNYLLADWVSRGQLLSLDEVGARFASQAFISGAAGLVDWRGKTWGVPLICGCGCVFYNRGVPGVAELVGEAKDFEALLQAFAATPVPAPAEAWTLNCYLLTDFLKLSGVATHRGSAEMLRAFGTAGARDFLKRCEVFFRDGKIFHGPVTRPFSTSVEVFKSGRIPTILGNSSAMLQIFGDLAFPLGVAAVPAAPGGGGELVGFVNVVSSATTKREACAALLEFMQREQVQRMFSMRGRLVANRNALGGLRLPFADDASARELAKALENSTPTMLDHRWHAELALPLLLENANRWQRGEMTLEALVASILGALEEKRNIRESP